MADTRASSVYVWDVWVRLCHWGVAAAVALAVFSAEQGMAWRQVHAWSGYTVVVLVTFRLLWGIWGSETARFSQFLAGPTRVINYLRQWRQSKGVHTGHNPLGGWASVLLLMVLFFQAGSGLFATDDILFSGPFNPWVNSGTADLFTSMHNKLSNVVIALVIVHLAALSTYRLWRGDRLVKPMITGYKDNGPHQPQMAPAGRALALLAGVIGGFMLLLRAASN